MSVRISYIIPVYNGEKYLSQCLDSLYDQGLTLDEFEVICIDDCSTDASVAMLKDYQKKHSNVRIVLHESNKKTGTSCNEGLEAAIGDYVWIVGQDDWIDKDWGKRLLSQADRDALDVLLFNNKQQRGCPLSVTSDKVFEDSQVMGGMEFVRFYFGDSFCAYLLGFEWRALYRREYLFDSGIGFVDGAIYEDTTFLFRAIWYAKRIKSLETFVYNYRVNEESITDANKRYKGWLAYEFAFVAGKEVLDLSKELEGTKESKSLYQQALWYFRSFTYKVVAMPIDEKRTFYNLVRENWSSVKTLVDLCPAYVRFLANPQIGFVFTSILKPAFRIKHLLKKKDYARGI